MSDMDLVNIFDRVIGTIQRDNVQSLFLSSGKYVRYANCFVYNSIGQLWIPTRPNDAKIAPGGLDFSASKHVMRGETYRESIIRGLLEELNLVGVGHDLEFLGKLYPQDGRPFFSMIFSLYRDEIPNPTGGEWLSAHTVQTRLATEVSAKLDLPPALRLWMDEKEAP